MYDHLIITIIHLTNLTTLIIIPLLIITLTTLTIPIILPILIITILPLLIHDLIFHLNANWSNPKSNYLLPILYQEQYFNPL